MKLKILFILICTALSAFALEDIAIFDLDPHGIESSQANIVALKLQGDLIRTGEYRVVERTDLHKVLKEQGLQSSGSVKQVVELGKILGIKRAVTGMVGKIDSTHFFALKLIDIESGVVLKSDYVSVKGDFTDCLNGSGYALQRLMGIAERPPDSVAVPNVKSIEVQTYQHNVKKEVHIYKHEAGTHGKPMFVICGFCQGKGYTMQDVGNGHLVKANCPSCCLAKKYSGPETNYVALTGKWIP